MPIYDYRCNQCGRRVSILWRTWSDLETKTPVCSRCGSHDLKRLVARVAVLHSEDSHLENLADPGAFGDLDENDPKSVARMMRKMSNEAGEDLGPEFSEVVDRLEAGQKPEDIEQAMPGLGAESAGDGGLDMM
jgi:putative FmdB family regulatory protein